MSLSILLPTYNSAHMLGPSVRSMLAQTWTEFELLILDDGSEDHTPDVVASFHDERIRYIRYPHRGLTATLNAGLREARYDIIARMDADDLCVPWRFERQLRALQSLPRNTLLSSWSCVFTNSSIGFYLKSPSSSDEIRKGLLLHSYISHPGLMCYKETLLKHGGYCNKAEIDAFEDYATWLKLKDDIVFHVIPEVLVFQRYRKESLSNNLAYKQKVMYAIQQPYYDDIRRHFVIAPEEEIQYRGWREYFYGKKALARRYWKGLGCSIVKSPRIVMAWLVTLFPEPVFVRFKEARIRFRLAYLFTYFSAESKTIRREFSELIRAQA
ncbi:MAG: glycosyltransferase family 2 protein [Acidobacteriota bacterium]